MIKVYKDWVIDADTYCYAVGNRLVKNKKGEALIAKPKYARDLTHAMQIIYDAEQKELIAKNDLTLPEAISKLNALHNEFKELLKGVKEKV
jgi:hypothetical protein